LRNFLNKLEGEYFTAPRQKFTDDTAMTKSVAKGLLNYDPGSYQKELAVNFVREYFQTPNRGYGSGVQDLFHHLKRSKFEDVLGPATYQFKGQGSYGNGAAMRISPVALYCLNKSEDFLIDLVKKTSVITHSNIVGVNGAILQALSVHKNLKMETKDGIDPLKYVDELLERFKSIETGQDELVI
jgi:poly(ADP-ribose) glycohydrolase ARH3